VVTHAFCGLRLRVVSQDGGEWFQSLHVNQVTHKAFHWVRVVARNNADGRKLAKDRSVTIQSSAGLAGRSRVVLNMQRLITGKIGLGLKHLTSADR
jgi:hypothetical protein